MSGLKIPFCYTGFCEIRLYRDITTQTLLSDYNSTVILNCGNIHCIDIAAETVFLSKIIFGSLSVRWMYNIGMSFVLFRKMTGNNNLHEKTTLFAFND